MVRRKLAAGAAVLGLVAGVSLIAPSSVNAGDAEAEPVSVSLTCFGADADSQTVLNLLGQLGGQWQEGDPPFSLPVTADVFADVPETAAAGEEVDVTFESKLVLSQTLIDTAVGFGILGVDVSNLDLDVEVTGGGEGGPFAASPTNFAIGFQPPSVPTLTAGGTVTITDDTVTTLFSVVDPVVFTVGISALQLSFTLSCQVPDGTYVAAINGDIPPPPPTTTTTAAPATTTTATAPPARQAAVAQAPRFTG